MNGSDGIVVATMLGDGLAERASRDDRQWWEMPIALAAVVLLVAAAQFALTRLPVARVDANPALAQAKPIESDFLRQEEGRAKRVLDVKTASSYLMLPASYGSPAATAMIRGHHVLGVSQQLLDLAKPKPDIVSAIVAHEVGHEWVHENRAQDSFPRTHGFGVVSLAVCVFACLCGLGRTSAAVVAIGATGFAAGLFTLSPSSRSSFEITSVAAMAGAFFSTAMFALPDFGPQRKLSVWRRLAGICLVTVTFVLSLLVIKPALDRENELEADRFAFQILKSSGRSDAMLPMMCWLENISPTARHPIMSIALDHPTNDARLKKLGFPGLSACPSFDASNGGHPR